jgi:excisionase family DNA binding protein
MSDQRSSDDDYLKPSEVARILHVSAKTIDRWANEGRIACFVTLGGHRRFRRTDVNEIAEQMVRRATSDPTE